MNWQQALKDYNSYLKIERGLSKNSIENYSRDVSKLVFYLEQSHIDSSPISITSTTIQEFIYESSFFD
jgi:integrase/recombinase XerD